MMWRTEPRGSATSDGSHVSPAVQTQARAIGAIVFFCASSLGAVFVNKACLTHFRFSYPLALMLMQAALTLCLAPVLARMFPSRFALSRVAPGDYARLAVPVALCVANVAVGLSALTRVNIPMFSAFRRLTVLFVMTAEYLLLRRTHSRAVMLAVITMSMGALVSALGDVTFTGLGYALVFANNFLTASYLTCIKSVMQDLKIDPFTLMYYTAAISFVPVLLLGIYSGDIANAYLAYITRSEIHSSIWFFASLFFVSISALCVNLSTSMCTHLTSPLTTAVAGQVKNVLQTVLGFFSWGYVLTPMNAFGLIVGLCGQVAFAYVKYNEGQRVSTERSVDQEENEELLQVYGHRSDTEKQELIVNLHKS